MRRQERSPSRHAVMTALLVAVIGGVAARASAKRPGDEPDRGQELRAVAGVAESMDELFVPVDGEILVSAERATIDETSGLIDAHGDVTISMGSWTLRCDHVALEMNTRRAMGEGACQLDHDEYQARFERAEIELDTLEGLVLEAQVEGEGGRYRFEAGRLHRMSDGQIFVTDGQFTACGCEDRVPLWGVEARFVRVAPDGQVRYRRGWFRLWRKRVIPIPSGSFDGVSGRASGLLAPEIRLGGTQPLSVGLPIYIATSRNTDLTVTPTYVDTRGFLLTSEFRYAVAPGQGGMISSSFIDDASLLETLRAARHEVIDDVSSIGYSQLRFWGQWRHIQRGADGGVFGAHVDVLRDDRILGDFEQDYTIRRTPYLVSTIWGGFDRRRATVRLQAEVYDDQSEVRNGTPLHELPRFSAAAVRLRREPRRDLRLGVDVATDVRWMMALPDAWQGDLWYPDPYRDIGSDGVAGSNELSWTIDDREEGNEQYDLGEPVRRALRLGGVARVGATWTPGGWLWVRPWVEGRGALYGAFRQHDQPGYLATALGGVELGTALYRDFDGGQRGGSWRHVIEPELAYVGQPGVVEGVHPVLGYDDLQRAHSRIEVELTNRLIRERPEPILRSQGRSQALEVRVATAVEMLPDARYDEDLPIEPLQLELAYRHRIARLAARTVVAWDAQDPFRLAGAQASLAALSGNQAWASYTWAAGGTEWLWAGAEWLPLLHGEPIDADIHEMSLGLRWVPFSFFDELTTDPKRIFRGFALRAQTRINLRGDLGPSAKRVNYHQYQLSFTSPCNCWRAGVDLKFANDWSSPSFGLLFDLLTQ